MKRYALLVLVLALFTNCKPMHRQHDSGISAAMAADGTLLTAVRGKEQGICMIQSKGSVRGNPRLLTVRGSISSDQLKKELRFMGYGEQLAAIYLPVLAGAAIIGKSVIDGLKAVGKIDVSTSPLDSFDQDQVKALAKVPVGFAIGGAVALGGMLGYHIVKGNVDGEKGGTIAARTALAATTAALPLAPTIEANQRDSRVKTVLSDKEQWNITNRKMNQLANRIDNIDPKYHGDCDHLLEEFGS